MSKPKRQKNDFGMEVHNFCGRTGITKKDLAKEAGVAYCMLLAAGSGDRPGEKTVEAVRKYMAKYESNDKQTLKIS